MGFKTTFRKTGASAAAEARGRYLDDAGNVLALTFEHASSRTDLTELIVEGLAA